MFNKKNKTCIIILIIVLLIGSGRFVVIKYNEFNKMILPAVSVKLGNEIYCVNISQNDLYRIRNNDKAKLIMPNVDRIGIIIFKGKLYYINNEKNKICSSDLKGENIKEIDKCNIVMPNQPIFKLGDHIYYYNSKNSLSRVDKEGNPEKVF